MRLHLNKTLRAALIAAITAVGMTLPQSFAAGASSTYTIITFAQEGNTTSWADYNIYHSGLPSSGPAGGPTTVVSNAALGDSGVSYSVKLVDGGGKIGTDTALNVSGWTNQAALDAMNTAMGTTSAPITTTQLGQCSYLYGWQANRQTSEVFNFTGATVDKAKILNDYTATFYVGVTANAGSPANFRIEGMTDTVYEYATETGNGFSSSQAYSAGGNHLTIVKVTGTVEDATALTFTSNGTNKNGISFIAYNAAAPAPVETYIWAGTADNHVLTSNVWWNEGGQKVEYSPTAQLVFGANDNKTVTVDSTATSKSMEVQSAGYVFENSGSLTVQKLTVAEDASLVLKGEGSYIVNKVAVAATGSLTIDTDTTVQAANGDAAKSLLVQDGVTNKGTFLIGDSLTIDGSLTSKMGGTVAVAAGKKLTLGTTKDSHTIDLTSLDALVLGQGANIDTKAYKATIKNLTANGSTLKMLDTKDKGTDGVILQGTTTLDGNLTITSDWKYRINIEKLAGTGSLELTGGNEEHRAVIGDADIHSLNITNKMNEVWLNGTVTLDGTLNVGGTTHVTGENTLTVGGLTGGAAMDVANGITFTAETGTYTYTGTLTVGGQIVKQGVGTQTITGGAGTQTTGGVALHRALDVQAGTLVLNGNFAIDAITDGNIEHKTVNYEGTASDNGFDAASGSMTVYDTHSDTGTLDLTNGHFLYGGADVTDAVKTGNGVYELSLAIDKTVVYVNTGSLDIAKYKEAAEAAGVAISRVELKSGTTVNMDAAITTALKHVDGTSATVTATEDITLTSIDGPADGETLTFSAEDHTVTVQGDNAFMGDIVVDKGTVKLGSAQGARSLGAFNGNHVKGEPAPAPDKTITINEGGTIDLNGKPDLTYVYTLNGGSLVNNGANISDGSMQTTGVKLTDDSFIGGTGNLYLLGPGYDNTTLELNGYTLTKTGTNTLGLRNTAVSSGTLEVQGGTVNFINGDNSSVEADIVLNGGNIAGNVNMAGDITITTKEDTATNATINVGDHELTLSTDDDMTLTLNRSLTIGEGSVNVTGTGTLLVNCTLDLGDKLTGEGNIAVGASGNLTLTGGSTISSIIQNSGSVSLTGLNLDTDNFTETQGQDGAHFGLDGQETTGANYFEGTSASFVQVVDGGTSTGSELTWGELSDQTLTDGKIITVEADIDYDTFYVGGEISTSDINASAHAGDIANINVEYGGTLNVNEAVSQAAIHAGDGATVAGEKAQDTVQIRMGETVAYADGIKADNGSAQFTGDVQVTNSADDATFSVTNADMEVRADALTYGVDATNVLEITCGVDVDTITNQSGQDLILNKLVVSELGGVSALSGDIVLASTQDALTINNLEIQAGQAVQALKGSSGAEITVTVTDTLTAGGNATLLANLEMANDSALLLDAVQQGLSIGSELTMNTGIQMDEATLRALDNMEVGKTFWLIGAAEGTTMEYAGASGEDAWYDAVFSRIAYGDDSDYTLQGDFNIAFSETDGFGLKKFSNTPEPTTGTLSLLALCALAARRRRK